MMDVILHGLLALRLLEESALGRLLPTCAPCVGFQTMVLMVAQGTVLVQVLDEAQIPQQLMMSSGERLAPLSSDDARGNQLALLVPQRLIAPWQLPLDAWIPLEWLPQGARSRQR